MANLECHYLPDDIILYDILTKLPAKSVLRFKCVCKAWLRDTESSRFVRLHLRQSSRPSISLVLITDRRAIPRCLFNVADSLIIHDIEASSPICPSQFTLPHSLEQLYHNPEVIGSCNGLLLLRVFESGYYCSTTQPKSQYFLWNPSFPDGFRKLIFDVNIDNCPNQTSPWSPICLGYDDTSEEYKIILQSKDNTRATKSYLVVYRLRSNSWKSLDIPGDGFGEAMPKATSGAPLNNCLHFLSSHRQAKIIDRFDLRDEVWDELSINPQPNPRDGNSVANHIGVYKDMLSLVVQVFDTNWRFLNSEFWVMKEYGVKESWTRLFQAEPPILILGHVFYYEGLRDRMLLVVHRGCKYGTRLAWYNRPQDDGKFEEIEIQGRMDNIEEALTFFRSLVRVDHI